MYQPIFISWLALILVGTSAEIFAQEEVVERRVTVYQDFEGDGTLRTILRRACDAEGDDMIVFNPPRAGDIRIKLNHPLVIPDDCVGLITLRGFKDRDVILDGSRMQNRGGRLPGDSCLLHVYSDDHEIYRLSFVGNGMGAGLCIFSYSAKVEGNNFGKMRNGNILPNRYGIVVSNIFVEPFWRPQDKEVILKDNVMIRNSFHGIWNNTNKLIVEGNRVMGSGRTGVVLFGDEIVFEENIVGLNRGHGVYFQGDEAKIRANQILTNGQDGIRMQGEASSLINNTILANGGCPPVPLYESQDVDCLEDVDGGGVGVFIEAHSSHTQIGVDDLGRRGPNRIQFNRDGGIVIAGDETSVEHRVTQNIISKNYGVEIDLGHDGMTVNDEFDRDEGPNHLLNYPDYLVSIALVPGPRGNSRYWIWGMSMSGQMVEMYRVVPEEIERNVEHGGGDQFLGIQEIIRDRIQQVLVEGQDEFEEGDVITALTLTQSGDTSEFSKNMKIDIDSDFDGILDENETGDGTPPSGGSSPERADSDGDGLPDAVEDLNRNGEWEPNLGETSAYNADSDGDEISDWVEVHGDGRYDRDFDTHPLIADTDRDGLRDGAEDSNHNGVWEGFLDETSPLRDDSDQDGFSDFRDVCPLIRNPNQEPRFCRGL